MHLISGTRAMALILVTVLRVMTFAVVGPAAAGPAAVGPLGSMGHAPNAGDGVSDGSGF